MSHAERAAAECRAPRALLITNPRAGSGSGQRLVRRIVEVFASGAQPLALEPVSTTRPGAATELASQAAAAGVATVFVLGGDGSVREAACGLLGSQTALGVLPGGTTNVVARALGLPATPLAAAAVLAAGRRRRRIDLGEAAGEPFLMQASCGLDAAVMAGLDPRAKAALGRLGVVLGGLGAWWGYGFPTFAGLADGTPFRAQGVVVVNLAEYAGPFRIAPAAQPDDRQLDLVLWHGTDRGAALGFALDLVRGTHTLRGDVEIRTVGTLRLEATLTPRPPGGGAGAGAPDGELLYQIDGDPRRAALPIEVKLAAEQIEVLVADRPPATPGRVALRPQS